MPSALFGRGLAQARLGRPERGEADRLLAAAQDPKIAENFAKFGIRP